MRVLAKEGRHSSLFESYNEIINQPTATVETCEIRATFQTNNSQCHNSFLSQIIRDLKDQSEQ